MEKRSVARLLTVASALSIFLLGLVGSALAHPGPVVLKDKDGNPILLSDRDAGFPVSTEKTCFTSGCHGDPAVDPVDYATRSAGFHVQQGANELNKAADDGNNYTVAGRAFVQSPGMFGKW